MDGIQDSIRRCEELLTLTPLTFTPGESLLKGPSMDGQRRSFDSRCTSYVREGTLALGQDMDWTKNMDLCGVQHDLQPIINHFQTNSHSNSTQKLPSIDSYTTQCMLEFSAMPNNGCKTNGSRKSLLTYSNSFASAENKAPHGFARGDYTRVTIHQQVQNDVPPLSENASSENDDYSDDVSIDLWSNNINNNHNNGDEIEEEQEDNSAKGNLGGLGEDMLLSHSVDYREEEKYGDESCYSHSESETTEASNHIEHELPQEFEPVCKQEFEWEEPQEREMPNNYHSRSFEDGLLEEQRQITPPGDFEAEVSEGLTERFCRLRKAASMAADLMCSNPESISNNYQRRKSVAKQRCLERLNSLSRPKTEVYKKLSKLKALLEVEQLQECSFKPTICRKPRPESTHSVPIFDRIMEIQQRFEIRKRARKAYEKEEHDACSFWPRTNWQSQVLNEATHQPLEKRFQQLQKQKMEKLASAQMRKAVGLTFKPEINQRSVILFKQKGLEGVDVADRLTSIRHSCHSDCKHESEEGKATFTPEINKNTNKIIALSKQFGGCSAGFLERQQQYLQAVEEKKKFNGCEVQSDLTFHPNIGNSALILKQSPSRDVFNEKLEDRVERLAYKDKERQCQARAKVSEQYYSQFSFQPEIDKLSKVLAPCTSLQDLYKNEKSRKVKESLEQAAKLEFQQKYPFHPKVSSTTDKGNCIELRNIILQQRHIRKERRILENESRSHKELQDIKECTFKPYVNPTIPKDVGPVIVRGMGRHLELQCIAKQMKEQQEELERKVFFSHG